LSALPYPSYEGVLYVLVFSIFELFLLVVVPGPRHFGPKSPAGVTPEYRLNGVPCYLLTCLLLIGSDYFGFFRAASIYDRFGEMLSFLNIFALIICVGLVFKARLYPSGKDTASFGNFVWDFFWGQELYPTCFSISLKQLVNCRLGLMGWQVLILAYLYKQIELFGSAGLGLGLSVFLQSLYLLKFYVWEGGYFNTIDIMHDRFGFYLCWGCLCWVTGFYTAPTLFQVRYLHDISYQAAFWILLVGLIALWMNYDADRQRQLVRATNGKCKIWGSNPKTILAEYTTSDGKRHKNLLLYSGWWGVSRHFHYLPEITLALTWALPAGFSHFVPYFYVIFLTILLFDRSSRDDERCRTKYQAHWEQYCRYVPYKIIPYVY